MFNNKIYLLFLIHGYKGIAKDLLKYNSEFLNFLFCIFLYKICVCELVNILMTN